LPYFPAERFNDNGSEVPSFSVQETAGYNSYHSKSSGRSSQVSVWW